jgi:Limiting CO2-inducible proteins B/C beta carbonyic anhydrases
MAAHIPDDGYCLMIYGPHVGVAKDGTVGKVERRGIELVDTCCGSAVAASNYVKGITEGGAKMTANIQSFTDFQQVRWLLSLSRGLHSTICISFFGKQRWI